MGNLPIWSVEIVPVNCSRLTQCIPTVCFQSIGCFLWSAGEISVGSCSVVFVDQMPCAILFMCPMEVRSDLGRCFRVASVSPGKVVRKPFFMALRSVLSGGAPSVAWCHAASSAALRCLYALRALPHILTLSGGRSSFRVMLVGVGSLSLVLLEVIIVALLSAVGVVCVLLFWMPIGISHKPVA